jgi:hypothetical protein
MAKASRKLAETIDALHKSIDAAGGLHKGG